MGGRADVRVLGRWTLVSSEDGGDTHFELIWSLWGVLNTHSKDDEKEEAKEEEEKEKKKKKRRLPMMKKKTKEEKKTTTKGKQWEGRASGTQ